MNTNTHVGVWMDHSIAHIMELAGDKIISHTIENEFSHADKQQAAGRSEHLMHNKEQQGQAAFYKKIGEAMKPFREAVVFGPTTAKNELMNRLKAQAGFDSIKMEAIHAGTMTTKEQQAFVRDYFRKQATAMNHF